MNNRPILILTSIYLMAFLIGWFLFWPAWEIVANYRAEIKEWQTKIAEAKITWQTAQQRSAKINTTEMKNMIFSALPENLNEPELLVQFEALSSKNGLILNSVEFSEEQEEAKSNDAVSVSGSQMASPENINPTAASQVSSMPEQAVAKKSDSSQVKKEKINLVLEGDFSSFLDFVKATEKSLRLFDLISLDFSSSGSGSEGQTGTEKGKKFNISLRTYYLPNKK